MLFAFVSIAGAAGQAWPVVVAPGAALVVLFLSFLAPLVLEPIFNKFRPLADAGLTASLRELSERARVPVRDVLVADASRRTRKENAYVSGLGRTRRVTLMARAPARVIAPVCRSLIPVREVALTLGTQRCNFGIS